MSSRPPWTKRRDVLRLRKPVTLTVNLHEFPLKFRNPGIGGIKALLAYSVVAQSFLELDRDFSVLIG